MSATNTIEDTIKQCSLTGEFKMDWNEFKSLLLGKLDKIISEYECEKELIENSNEYKLIIQDLEKLKQTPFTIQRICDLLNEPKKWYRSNCTKFIFSFHKLVNLD
jgi:hypothetical protein